MKDSFVLKLLDRFRMLFEKAGIDYKSMRKILQLKLLMDQRRVPSIMNNQKNKEGKNAFGKSLLMYAFLGFFLSMFMFFPLPLYLKMNINLGMIIFMVMTTMISDFSSVLLDTRDKSILLPRPVDPRSINAARLLHVLCYLLSITLALAGFSAITGTIKYGPAFTLLFLVDLALICCFVIFITALLYFVILWFFDGEKLKDIINYFQIILSVFMAIVYQFTGRIFNLVDTHMVFAPEWWHFLLPSAWFSAPFSIFLEGGRSPYFIGMSIAAIVIPAAALTLYLKRVTPYFEKSLQKLNNHGGARSVNAAKARRKAAVARLFCADRTERSFFIFTRDVLANERKLKLSLYPSLAFSVIMPFIMMLSFLGVKKSVGDIASAISGGQYHLYIYLTAFLLAASVKMIDRSENYKGAWIYRVLPVKDPSRVLKGAFKAFTCKYVIPVYSLVSVLFLLIYGFRIVPDLILMFVNMMVLSLFLFRFSLKELPFSRDFQYSQGGNTVGIVLLSFVAGGLLAFIHYKLLSIPFGVTANIAVSLASAAVLWSTCFKFSWKDLRS